MPPTTADAIRDRIITVIAGLVPYSLAASRFRAYRNEGDADFITWAEANPANAFRRFQVRDGGDDESPEVSNTDTELRRVAFEVLVAYPQNNRTGSRAALDRDDAATEDRRQIEGSIGMTGRANFAAPYPDACWRFEDWSVEREVGTGVDFLRITVGFQFYLVV